MSTDADQKIFSPNFMAEFCEAVLQIAERKVAEGVEFLRQNPPKRPLLPRLSTGGRFGGIFLWDTAFCCLWAKHAPDRFPIENSLDNLYNLQEPDGYICREFLPDGTPFWSKEHPVSFNPPILAWAELELYQQRVTTRERLRKVYDNLRRHHQFCWRTYRRPDGLFFSDAFGCGMDSLPRLPKQGKIDLASGIQFERRFLFAPREDLFARIQKNPLYTWNRQMGWIDTSCQMAFNALNLSKIAEIIGETADRDKFKAQYDELKAQINEYCFDEERGFYFDYCDGKIIPRYHGGAMWALLAQIVPEECIERVVAVLKNPEIFNRKVVFPILGANEPDYDPENAYCLGAVWPYVTYVALRGLKLYGYDEFALACARKYYRANAQLYLSTHTVWENISAEQYDHPKKHAQPDFCGWSAIAPVAIYHEFLQKTSAQ